MRAPLRYSPLFALAAFAASPAAAHVGAGAASAFVAGFGHPFSGLDHVAAMVAVGLWAALKGDRAVWAWPLAFVTAMLAGGAIAMSGVSLPWVEPGILASVVVLGLLVAAAANLPVSVGAALIGVFALFHGHAHGAAAAGTAAGLEYMAGFAVATATLHAAGIAATLAGPRHRLIARAAGAAFVLIGLGLFIETL